MPIAADIVNVQAPSNAPQGGQVNLNISVMNVTGAIDGVGVDINIAVTAVFDSSPATFQFDYLLVSPFQTVVFTGWFTMPNKSVTVTISAWYWSGSQWVLDDQATVQIALQAAGVSEFKVSSFTKA